MLADFAVWFSAPPPGGVPVDDVLLHLHHHQHHQQQRFIIFLPVFFFSQFGPFSSTLSSFPSKPAPLDTPSIDSSLNWRHRFCSANEGARRTRRRCKERSRKRRRRQPPTSEPVAKVQRDQEGNSRRVRGQRRRTGRRRCPPFLVGLLPGAPAPPVRDDTHTHTHRHTHTHTHTTFP